MKNLLGTEALVRRRLRQCAEMLLEDSSLRSNLTDAQAQHLLDWALDRVQTAAMATAELGDAEAYPLLEEEVAVVRRLMRLVSRIMADQEVTGGNDLPDYLGQLMESMKKLTGQSNSPAQTAQVDFLRNNRDQLDSDTTFQLLAELIEPDRQQSHDEEE